MNNLVFGSLILACAASGANALTTTNTTDAAALAAASLAASSGITIVGGSESLIGSDIQQGTYTGFNLTSATAGNSNLSLGNGVFLTSGGGDFTTTNTTSNYNKSSSTGSYAPLVALAGAKGMSTLQYDSNVLSFDFTLDDPTQNAVKAQFVFATDEFSTQSVTDILGIFVNGTNYAFFPNGDLVSNQSGDPHDFFNDNEYGVGTYNIEWDGLTAVFDITLLANGGGAVNTFTLAIADTTDTIFDSAVFFTGLKAATDTGGGGIDPTVPLPAAGWLLVTAFGGAAALSRRKRA